MKERLVRAGMAAALVVVVGGIAAVDAAAEEVVVGDVVVTVPGLTVDAGSTVGPISIGDSDDDDGGSAVAGTTRVSVGP